MTARMKYRFGPGLARAGLRWTDDELKTLAALYLDTPMKDISQKMQRTVKSLRLKVEELQLHRSAEFVGVIRSEAGMKGYVARLRNAEAGRAETLDDSPAVARVFAPDKCPFVARTLSRLPALERAWRAAA